MPTKKELKEKQREERRVKNLRFIKEVSEASDRLINEEREAKKQILLGKQWLCRIAAERREIHERYLQDRREFRRERTQASWERRSGKPSRSKEK